MNYSLALAPHLQMQSWSRLSSRIPTPPTSQKHHWNPGIPTHGVNPTSGCWRFLGRFPSILGDFNTFQNYGSSTIYDDILDFERSSDPVSIQKKKHTQILSWLLDLHVIISDVLPSSLSTTKSQIHAIIQVGKWVVIHQSVTFSLKPLQTWWSNLPFCRQLDVTPWCRVTGGVPHTLITLVRMGFQRPTVSFRSNSSVTHLVLDYFVARCRRQLATKISVKVWLRVCKNWGVTKKWVKTGKGNTRPFPLFHLDLFSRGLFDFHY